METFMQALSASFRDALGPFMAAIPKIIAFLAIVVIGWVIAALIARAVTSLLRMVKFNDLSERAGFNDMVHKMGMRADGAAFLGLVAKWFVRLITLVVAFDALGLPAVSEIFDRLLMWLPNLAVALVVLVIGGFAANALSGAVRGAMSKSELGNPNLLANITRGAIWAFAVVVAVNQLGIATVVVNALFIAIIGAVALAVGLAFGLGGRDTASGILRRWYERSSEAATRIQMQRGVVRNIEDEMRPHH